VLKRFLTTSSIFAILAAGQLLLSQNVTIVVVEEGLGKVVEIDPAHPTHPTEIQVGLKPHEIAVSSDGRTAYVSNFGLLEANLRVGIPGKTISVIDLAKGTEVQKFTLPQENLAAPHGVKLRPSNTKAPESELFTNAEIGDTMLVFDIASGKVLRTFPLPPGVHNFIFSPDGKSLFAFSTKGLVYRIDPDLGNIQATADVPSPRGLAWSADNSSLIVSGKGELQILNPKTLAVVKTFSNLGVGQIFYPAVSLDGRFIFAPAVLDGVVLIIDAASGKVLHRVSTGSPLSVTLQPDGKVAWVSNVRVPQEMLPPGSEARPGGVTALNLTSLTASPLPGAIDANGLAVVSQDFVEHPSLH